MHIYAHEELNNSPLTQTNTILTPHSDLSIMGSTMLPKTPIDKKQLSKQASNEQPQTSLRVVTKRSPIFTHSQLRQYYAQDASLAKQTSIMYHEFQKSSIA
jgi:hypothetical protein